MSSSEVPASLTPMKRVGYVIVADGRKIPVWEMCSRHEIIPNKGTFIPGSLPKVKSSTPNGDGSWTFEVDHE